MSETILRTASLGKGWQRRKYALTENYYETRTRFGLDSPLNKDYRPKNLALRPVLEYYPKEYYNSSFFDRINYTGAKELTLSVPSREKVYLSDTILRFTPDEYTSQIPKGGTGRFGVHDSGFHFSGEMKNGKVINLNTLSQCDKSTSFANKILYSEGLSSKHAKYYFEKLVK